MALDSITLLTDGIANSTGIKLNMSLLDSFDFFKGVDTIDLSIVSGQRRALVPSSGAKEDYDFSFELIDDGTNKGFNIDNIGNETPQSIVTTDEQFNFLLDNIMTGDVNNIYVVFIDWSGKSLIGTLTVRGRVSGQEFFSRIVLSATLKVGDNILGSL